jgi:hypothetical protein
MTWVVATAIILIVLIVSVFLSSLIGNYKTVPYTNQVDLFADKSMTAYLLTEDPNGGTVYNQIASNGQLNDFEGNLAQTIFTTLYNGYYSKQIFLGLAIDGPTCILLGLPYTDFLGTGFCLFNNKYFNLPSGTALSPSNPGFASWYSMTYLSNSVPKASNSNTAVIYTIHLINNKYLQLVLWH